MSPFWIFNETLIWCYLLKSLGGGWVWQRCRVSCHQGIQLILAYSWARPAILLAGKGWGRMFYFFCFFTFIPVPLSSLPLSYISPTISSMSFLPFSGRWHKMTHKGWCVAKPQHSLFKKALIRFAKSMNNIIAILYHCNYVYSFFGGIVKDSIWC